MAASLYHTWLCARPVLVFPPVIGAMLIRARPSTAPVAAVVLLLAGLFVWTFIEWAVHWSMHVPTRSPGFRRLQRMHLHHHQSAGDPASAVTPLCVSVPVAGLLFLIALAVLRDLDAACVFHAGLLTGYVLYEAIHVAVHAGWRRGGLRALDAYHERHHAGSWRRTLGVTSPLWDWIFRTIPANRDGTTSEPRP
jgi:hypothetical protein